MLKSLLMHFPLVCLFLFSALLAGCSDSPLPAAQNGTQNSTAAQLPDDSTTLNEEDALSLALQAIDMSQGQDGFEVWRLKAEWANMAQEDGKIIVHLPRLTYFMPPPDEGEMHIVSKSGTIYQQEQVLQFIDNVVVSQEGSRITGDLLVYNGTAATMTFPEGGVFEGEGMGGRASIIRWHMNQRRIEANDHVSIDFNKENTARE